MNYFTEKPYSGENAYILACMTSGNKYKKSKYATYKQWLDNGYQVKKGSKGVGLKRVIKYFDKKGKEKSGIKYFTVFNIEQVDKI